MGLGSNNLYHFILLFFKQVIVQNSNGVNTPVKTWIGVTIIIAAAVMAGMSIWYCQKNYVINYVNIETPQINKKACTEEAKVCPDGSAVGRTGPNCEFAPCFGEGKDMVGNDRDEHGCIGSAGYSWCEEKQKCLRTWEESCGTEE